MIKSLRHTPLVLTETDPRDRVEKRGSFSSSSDFASIIQAIQNTGYADNFTNELVNEWTAKAVPAVSAAIGVISTTIASLPFHLYVLKSGKNSDGSAQKALKSKQYRLVHDQVNSDGLTSTAWRLWALDRLMSKGRCYTKIERDADGNAIGLWPMVFESTQFIINPTTLRKEYHYNSGTKSFVYSSNEVLDLIWKPHPNPSIGHIDPINESKNAIALAIAAERYAARMFYTSGLPRLQLECPPDMKLGAASRAVADMMEAIMIAAEENKPILPVPHGFKLSALGLDGEKLQMLELRKFQIQEISRIWRVPASFIGDHSASTFTNSEQMDLAYSKHTIAPICKIIEQEMNAKMFGSPTGRSTLNYYVEFDLAGLERGDTAARYAGYASGITNGWLTPDDARAKENMPSVEGGDTPFIQGAMIPLKIAAKATAPLATTKTEAPADPNTKEKPQ